MIIFAVVNEIEAPPLPPDVPTLAVCRNGTQPHTLQGDAVNPDTMLLKKKFFFLHVKPYNKDISDQI